MASIPLLTEASPAGDYVVETHLTMDLPTTGSNFNYARAFEDARLCCHRAGEQHKLAVWRNFGLHVWACC